MVCGRGRWRAGWNCNATNPDLGLTLAGVGRILPVLPTRQDYDRPDATAAGSTEYWWIMDLRSWARTWAGKRAAVAAVAVVAALFVVAAGAVLFQPGATPAEASGGAPTISSVALVSTPANSGTYRLGEVVTVRVTFSETVTVTGRPRFFMDFGLASSNDYYAAYYSTSSGSNVDFTYTVQAGDSDSDGISIDWNSIRLDGGTIQDSDGHDADLGHAGMADQSEHKVDGNTPGILSLSLTSTPSSGDTYGVGEVVTARVTFSESVMAQGALQLTLNVGGTSRTATYDVPVTYPLCPWLGHPFCWQSSGTSLDFAYTVQSSDSDSDGISIDANSLGLNGGSIWNFAGSHADLSHATEAADSGNKVDAVAPTVSSVALTSTPADGDTYGIGEVVAAQATFSETVTVTGAPQLTLNVGGTSRTATFSSSSESSVDFTYTVQAGDSDADGISIAANSIGLNSGTIQDSVGNNATLSHAGVAAKSQQKVDGVVPTILSLELTSTPVNGGTYRAGEPITARVNFSETVTVTGAPSIMQAWRARPELIYSSGSGSSSLYFTGSGEEDVYYDSNGISIGANSVQLNGGTIRDSDGYDAALSHAALAAQSGHKLDTLAPGVLSVGLASTPANGGDTYIAGEVVTARVTFNEAVAVTGAPQLTLNVGGTSRTATYDSSASSGAKLDFTYAVQSGDSDSDGISIDANSLALNGGTILDSDGYPYYAALDHTAVAAQSGHQVDGIVPTVVSVTLTSTPVNSDTYVGGSTVAARVTFSKTLTVTGAPQLTLNVGDTSRTAKYSSDSSGSNVDFTYTVQSDDLDSDGISIDANSLALNGGTIRDSVGNNATLSHTAVAADSKQKVDGDTPGIVSVGLVSTLGTYHTYVGGQVVRARVTFSEAVTVTGPPRFLLDFGAASSDDYRTATYNSATSSGANVDFTYTVQLNDDYINGISIDWNSIRLNGGTIQDSDGNDAALGHVGIPPQSEHRVDGDGAGGRPIISGMRLVSTPAQGDTYRAGEVIVMRVWFSEEVTVWHNFGRMWLNFGKLNTETNRRMAYYSNSHPYNPPSLYFTYTVQSGDSAPNGISVNASSVWGTMTTSLFEDPIHNPWPIHTSVPADPNHKVDGDTPGVRSVSIVSRTAIGEAYAPGEIVTARVAFSEAVTVTGAPQLTLNVGGTSRTAKYSSDSSGSNVDFTYTVQSDDLDSDGISIDANSLALNGGTIQDSDSEDAVLVHSALAAQYWHKVDNTKPYITAVGLDSTPIHGDTYVGDQDITARVTFSEAVTVTGAPQLTLNVGGTSRTATYSSASSGANVDFTYTVQSDDLDSDGISIDANSVQLNGGTIQDSDSKDAVLRHDAVAAQSGNKVDGDRPGILSVSLVSTTATGGPYLAGEVVRARVTFNEAVTVTGSPRFILDFGEASSDDYRGAAYSSATSSGANVDFTYTVQSGDDNDSDGISIDWNSIRLDGGSIQDSNGNDAALGHAGIGHQSDHKVDADVVGQTVRVSNVATLGCLDVKGGTAQDGQEVWSWVCHGGDSQRWVLERYASGSEQGRYRLVSKLAGGSYCLDNIGVVASGSDVHMWTCHGDSHDHVALQAFDLEYVSGNSYRIQFRKDGNTTYLWGHVLGVGKTWQSSARLGNLTAWTFEKHP